jgi:hypothetical protein
MRGDSDATSSRDVGDVGRLTRVAPGQVRFGLPGLAVDARGVALGRELLARFGTLERLVAFLRLLTAEQRLDDLVAGLALRFARAGAGAREVLVLLPCLSSELADVVARAARLAGGAAFTGTGRHFVPARDGRASLGYDVTQVSSDPGDAVLYGDDHATSYRFEGELSLEKLIYRLPLVREPALPSGLEPEVPPALAYLVVRQGLAPPVLRQLARAGVRASAAPCEATARALDADGRFWLFRLESPPRRLWALLRRTPGVSAFLPVGRRAAVAIGHHHPLHLEACEAVLGADRLVLFEAPPTAPRLLAPPPPLAAIGDLVRLTVPRVEDVAPRPAQATSPVRLETPLRLVRATDAGTAVTAALVPWERVRWLLRLCYALPAPALRGHRVAFLTEGALVVALDGLTGVPFGSLYAFAAPGVLVPVGMALSPAATPALVAERLGTGDGSLVLFRDAAAPPVRVPAAALERLERRLLAGLAERVGAASTVFGSRGDELAPATASTPEIAMDPVGVMPLWGLAPSPREP